MKLAIEMYQNMFDEVLKGFNQIKYNTTESVIKDLIFTENSIIVIPGPWANPIKYCLENNLKYVIMLSSPGFSWFFSNPVYIPQNKNNPNLKNGLIERFINLLYLRKNKWGVTFDTAPATKYPALRLFQTIPALSKL